MNTDFLAPDDPRWIQVLDVTDHDIYHRPEYVRACAGHEGGEPVAFYASTGDDAFLLPLLVRPLPHPVRDASARDAASPYGYPGPLCTTPNTSDFWTAFEAAARKYGLVSIFLRLNPLLPSCREGLPTAWAVVEEGPTVVVDCTHSLEALWDDTRAGHRSDINRLNRHDYQVTFDEPEALDVFVRLYTQTMERVGADPTYVFDTSYYHTWTDELAPYGHLVLVRSASGTPAAAGIFTDCNGRMQYHLSGTDAGHRDFAPSKLMLHEVRTWAHREGRHTVHLGGGLGGAIDSLFAFKAGFSSERAAFRSVRIVINAGRYDDACTAAGVDVPASPADGFFPAYRSR